jgi:hypothetical protein
MGGIDSTQNCTKYGTFLNSTEYTASVYVKRNVGLQKFCYYKRFNGTKSLL